MRHKVGDIVKLHKGYNSAVNYSPKNTEGRIVSVGLYLGYPVKVHWDNKTSNIYRENDLRLVRRPE